MSYRWEQCLGRNDVPHRSGEAAASNRNASRVRTGGAKPIFVLASANPAAIVIGG